jgi:PIN domain nuclease of toxin-antitoxin system
MLLLDTHAFLWFIVSCDPQFDAYAVKRLW